MKGGEGGTNVSMGKYDTGVIMGDTGIIMGDTGIIMGDTGVIMGATGTGVMTPGGTCIFIQGL